MSQMKFNDENTAIRLLNFIASEQRNINADNRAKGFWNQQRNEREALALVVCEMAEAIEQHRIGNLVSPDKVLDTWRSYESDGDEKYMLTYRSNIKESTEEELADVLIRIADLCGFDWMVFPYTVTDVNAVTETPYKLYSTFNHQFTTFVPNDQGKVNFAEIIMRAIEHISVASRVLDTRKSQAVNDIYDAAWVIAYAAEQIGCLSVMQQHVKMKLRYNTTRAYLHGKKY